MLTARRGVEARLPDRFRAGPSYSIATYSRGEGMALDALKGWTRRARHTVDGGLSGLDAGCL